MALIKCPECDKEVSDKVHKCVNCGFEINKPKRGPAGILFKYLFMIFNVLMGLTIIAMLITGLSQDNVGAAAGMSMTIILGIWVFFGLPLALMSYLTRPKAYE